MKKNKKPLIIIPVILVLYFVLVLIESNRFISNNSDLILASKTEESYGNVQNGIFYKAIRYNDDSSKIINGKVLRREFKSLFFHKEYYEFLDSYNEAVDSDSFKINNTGDYNDYEVIYKKGDTEYEVSNPNIRYIVFKDGSKVSLKEALEKGMVTIEQVKEKGLKVIELIKDPPPTKVLYYITTTELENKINNKESFVFVLVGSGCSHCVAYIPKIETIAKSYKFFVYLVDIYNISSSDYEKLNKIVEFEGTPTTYFFNNGKLEKTKIVGNQSESVIIEKLQREGYIK